MKRIWVVGGLASLVVMAAAVRSAMSDDPTCYVLHDNENCTWTTHCDGHETGCPPGPCGTWFGPMGGSVYIPQAPSNDYAYHGHVGSHNPQEGTTLLNCFRIHPCYPQAGLLGTCYCTKEDSTTTLRIAQVHDFSDGDDPCVR